MVRARHDSPYHRQPPAPVLQRIQPHPRNNRVRVRPRVHRRLPGPMGHGGPEAPKRGAVFRDLPVHADGDHRFAVDPARLQRPQRRAAHAASPSPLPRPARLQTHSLLEERLRHRRRLRETVEPCSPSSAWRSATSSSAPSSSSTSNWKPSTPSSMPSTGLSSPSRPSATATSTPPPTWDAPSP